MQSFHCFVFRVKQNSRRAISLVKQEKARVAGIAALVFLSSCVTAERLTDTHISSTNDSIVSELKMVIERQKSDYSALQEKYEQIYEQLTSESQTEQSEITVTERFDSTGLLVERVRNEKLTSNITKLSQSLSKAESENLRISQECESYKTEIDSLKAEIHSISTYDTDSVVIKKEVPKWCWFFIGYSVISLLIAILKLVRKFII